ncbi:MAG: hypothetical protein KAS66_00340 [Candidatus Omnitrophica bacterium]|nr:hypothetical protein [Candidatus Omnitrophota bacterium]
MAYDRLNNIPIAFTAGSNLRIDLSLPSLLASEGGSIAVYFRGPGDVPDGDFTTGTDGDLFTIDALPAATTKWPPGIYAYTIKHTDTAGIVDIAKYGTIEILYDPIQKTTHEARTFTAIFLERLQELALEISKNPYKTIQLQDSIYSLQNMEQLEALIEKYKNMKFDESQADLLRQGKDVSNDIVFSFNGDL